MIYTLSAPVTLTGTGIHSGLPASLRLIPTQTPGIRFIRTDKHRHVIPATPENMQIANRASILEYRGVRVATPEHILAALSAYHLFAMDIEIDQEEVPIMDGSALAFDTAILQVGRLPLELPETNWIIRQPILFQEKEKAIIALPAPDFQLSYILDYPNHFAGAQTAHFHMTHSRFSSDIAAARTYGFDFELTQLQKLGLAKGASLDNAILITPHGYSQELRFTDELVRHKILDMMGDFCMLGGPIQGHIIANKTGHEENRRMVQEIMKRNVMPQ